MGLTVQGRGGLQTLGIMFLFVMIGGGTVHFRLAFYANRLGLEGRELSLMSLIVLIWVSWMLLGLEFWVFRFRGLGLGCRGEGSWQVLWVRLIGGVASFKEFLD